MAVSRVVLLTSDADQDCDRRRLRKTPHPIAFDRNISVRLSPEAREEAMKRSFFMAVTLGAPALAQIGAASADPIADFYRGKTVRSRTCSKTRTSLPPASSAIS
jgi:hypothetical protein